MADGSLADAEASGIYQIRNLVSGKRYIGSAVCFRRRWYVHRHQLENGTHHSRYLLRAWQKHGPEAFAFEILECCAAGDLVTREQSWMDSLRPEYNLSPTAGSCLGVKHSEATRRKRSDLNKGNKFSAGRKPSDLCIESVKEANRKRKGNKRAAEAVAKTAAAHIGMKRSEETRRRISESRIGKKMPPRSDSHRANLSSAQKGKAKSPDHMAALQRGRSERVYTQEQRSEMSESLRRQYETGVRRKDKPVSQRHKIGRSLAALADDQVREIRVLLAAGAIGLELAQRFSVPTSTISQIRHGKAYRWVD